MHYVSYKQRRLLRLLLLGLLSLLLAACSTTSTPELNPETENSPAAAFAYVATTKINDDASQAEIEAVYGGSAIVFKPEAGFAILGFSETEASLTTLATDPNTGAFSSPEVSASGVDAWAGGVDAWAGGWDAWAGGWDAWAGGHGAWSGGHGAWSGGESQQGPASNETAFDQIKLDEAHALSRKFGDGVTVAVIDTGVDLNHNMLSGSLTSSSSWKDYIGNDSYPQEASWGSAKGHGTAAAGIVLQVAPRAKIMPIRVLDANGVGDTDDVILAIDHAVAKGADVINLSAGANVYVAALQAMIDYANSQGVYVVASSGNNGRNGQITYPAKSATEGDYAKLISVSSVDKDNNPSSFASHSAALQYFAPGENIRTAYPGNKTAKAKGTSFAAPIVSGALALAKSEVSSSYHNRLNKYLKTSTDAIGYGDGRLNIEQFIRNLPSFVEPTYQLVNARSSKCIEAEQSSVYQYACDGYHAQIWKIQTDGDSYKIINNSTGKVLDVNGTTSSAWNVNGQSIIQVSDNGNVDRRWYLLPGTNGYSTVVSKASGKCLHIANGSYSNSAKVDQYTCNGANSMQFEIRRVN